MGRPKNVVTDVVIRERQLNELELVDLHRKVARTSIALKLEAAAIMLRGLQRQTELIRRRYPQLRRE